MSPYIDIISRGSLTQGNVVCYARYVHRFLKMLFVLGYACMDFSLKIHKHHDVN